MGCAMRKLSLRAYTDSKDPDQPAHPCSLIGAFYCPITDSLGTTGTTEWMENKGPDETHVQDDFNLRILCNLEDTFWLNTAHRVNQYKPFLTFLQCILYH